MKPFFLFIVSVLAIVLQAAPAWSDTTSTAPPESSNSTVGEADWPTPPPDPGSHDKAVGCDCAKDDIDDILQEQYKVVLPVTMMLGGENGFPDRIQDVLDSICACVEYGIAILGQFKCGGCVDTNSGLAGHYYDLFTYDCCCDSDLIKDHVKRTINAIALAIPHATDMGTIGATILDGIMDRYMYSLKLAIRGIIDDYHPEVVEPTTAAPE